MSEEKDLQTEKNEGEDELKSFVDLDDLSDFEDLDNKEMFMDLGDLEDLGDIPDISMEENSNTEEPEPETISDIPDISAIEEPESEEISDIPDISAIEEPEPEEISDIPDMSAIEEPESEEISDIPDISAIEEPESEEISDIPDISAIEEPESEETISDIPDISAIEEPESEEISDIPDISQIENSEENNTEDILAMPEDMDFDSVEPEPMAAEENNMQSVDDSLNDIIGLDDTGVGDSAPNDALEPGVADAIDNLALDDDISANEIPSDMNDTSELDSMLDGLLDSFDMNGEIQPDNNTESKEQSENVAEESGMDDILGLAGSPFASEEMDIGALDDVGDLLENMNTDMLPEEDKEEEKKPGFFKRIFGNVVNDEIAEQERLAAEKAEEDAVHKEEEDQKAKEEAETKKAEKQAEKEAQKAAKAEEKKKAKEAKKAEKEAKKAKREEEEAAEFEVVGKLNKIGVSIVVIATIAFLTFEISGTNIYGYLSSKKKAENYFEMGKYTEAYQEAIGTDMRNKDEESYNKIKTVMKVQQSLNAYQNYDRMKYYPEALDALIRGIKRYDENIDQGANLGVDKDMRSCRKQIVSILNQEFGMSEAKVYSLLELNRDEYTKQVVAIGVKKQ